MALKNYLQQFTKEQLIKQILELSKKYKEVNTYYAFSINPDGKAKAEELKNSVMLCFYPKRGYNLDLKTARKTVNDFKKLSPGEEVLVDLMLHFVECGVRFTNDYGDIGESFYTSMENMFDDTCKLIAENGLKEIYNSRCEKVFKDTENVGWGFHDTLSYSYELYVQK